MVTPVANFQHFETHHCVSGSLRHMYAFHGQTISEEMLLGLGEGVGFVYWHQTGQPPFIGGRASPEPSMEEIAGQRTGVRVEPHATGSAARAEKALLDLLAHGQPVMLQVDMGFLPYFDFGGSDYHFGGHVIVACGYDTTTHDVLIADREAELHPVPLARLAQARGSTHKPFPPKNRWWTFDFSRAHAPTPSGICAAIHAQAQRMMNPPISNLGVKGIAKAAQQIRLWGKTLTAESLKWTLFNSYIFISPVGGTGGGTFRYMFSRFLRESAHITGDARLGAHADAFLKIADRWAQVGDQCKIASEATQPADYLTPIADQIAAIAELEQAAWQPLAEYAEAMPA